MTQKTFATEGTEITETRVSYLCTVWLHQVINRLRPNPVILYNWQDKLLTIPISYESISCTIHSVISVPSVAKNSPFHLCTI